MNWNYFFWGFDFVIWYCSIRSALLDLWYLRKLRDRIDEKYPTLPFEDLILILSNNKRDVDNLHMNNELKMKILEVKRSKVLLQFWRSYSYFYNDSEFPSKEEIMLLRMKK